MKHAIKFLLVLSFLLLLGAAKDAVPPGPFWLGALIVVLLVSALLILLADLA